MRAVPVLLGVLISGSALADVKIGLDSAFGSGKGCRIEISGGNDLYPAVAIEAHCADGTKWIAPHWPPEKADATVEWSRQNRILERLLAGEAITIPEEHRRHD